MKRFIIGLILLIVMTSSKTTWNEYKAGWDDGYANGWCYNEGYGCYPPPAPYPPYPRYGEDNYTGGYNRGFIKGYNDNVNNK